MFTIQTESVKKTLKLGEAIGRHLTGGSILALTGELGSGKTTFVKGLARGLDIPDVITSPTFVLVKSYQGRFRLHHMDFYRLNHSEDLESIGLEDYFEEDGIVAIEWAEKFFADIPSPFMHIRFLFEEEQKRTILIESSHDPDWLKT